MTDQPHSSTAGSPFDDLAVTVQLAEPLAKHTWLGVGGVAQYFCEPVSVESLSAIVSRCNETKNKLRGIGGGSNVLVPTEGV